jgi:PAS domain S-box-containing protein
LLIETVQDYAIFILDRDGRVATWNRGAERIKGYGASEIVGKHFSTFYTAEDLAARKPERALEVARAQGRVEDEGLRVRKDGSLFWASVVLTALFDERGDLRAFVKITRDLTARRAAEEQLRRSEERFRTLIEAVSDYAIYMLDPSGRVTTWNSGAEQLKGYKSDEIIGQHFSLFFPEEDARAGKPQNELRVATAQGRFEEEGYRIRKDGSKFWANVVVTPVRSPQGNLLGFAKVTQDLSGRLAAEHTARQLIHEQAARAVAQAAENRVRESEERYRALSRRLEVILESVADSITVQDRTGRVVFANTAAATSAGLSSVHEFLNAAPDDIVKRFELFDEKGAPLALSELPGRRVLAGERASSLVLIRRHPTTRATSWMLVKATPVLDAQGQPEFAVNVWHDITDARRREQHGRYLAQATGALSSTLDHDEMLSTLAKLMVPMLADWCAIHLLEADALRRVALAHVDPEKVAFAETVYAKYPPARSQARGLWRVVQSGLAELFAEVPDELLVSSAQGAEHLAALRAAGMHSAMLVPIRGRDEIIGVITLVSAESKRAFDRQDLALAEELGRRAGTSLDQARLYHRAHEAARIAKEAAKQAEEANRVKDEFLATVSHELRTPLNSILGWSSVLRDRHSEASFAKGLEVIRRSAVAQSKIIEDILDVSRIITGKLHLELKSTDLAAITRSAIEVIRPAATAKKLSIKFEPGQDAILVADPERLQQVVWNLLSNAVKFSESGGDLTICIRHEGSRLELIVRDSGTGIHPDFLPFVFDRFKQADGSSTRRVGGLGLGLAIVRHLVELHGGHVEAMSEGLGHGATFTVTLPVRAVQPAWVEHGFEDHAESREASSRSGAAALEGTRILVVDDERDARDLLEAVLRQAGATVATAGSSQEGFEAIQSFRPHVMVSDIGMPGEDGYAFVRRVNELDPELGGSIPSLALTAYTRNEDKARALAMGFTTHLGKPVDPDALIAAVVQLAAYVKR